MFINKKDKSMLPQYKKKTNLLVGVGFIFHVLGYAFNLFESFPLHKPLFMLIGAVLTIWGCVYYMRAKGYNGAFGLFGLLGILGFIILIFFPDKNKEMR